jgi:mannosyl-3-phosphoglycerate phosphatase
MQKTVVFTDLDGTLIDHDTYDFTAARDALDLLKTHSIPVVICSSKTRSEIEIYRQRMGINDPFISENGGAVFLPDDDLRVKGTRWIEKDGYKIIELGLPYRDLCTILRNIKRQENLPMKGFSEMTIEDIAACTNLPYEEARLAAKREYSEPFIFSGTPAQFDLFVKQLHDKGLRVTRGGRFHHLIGSNDKGRAVRILKKIYADMYPNARIRTIGLGDSANDVPMLQQVDVPVVIRKKTGAWEPVEGIDVLYADKAGPRGWAEAIHEIL